MITRRYGPLLAAIGLVAAGIYTSAELLAGENTSGKPNIILCMSDDQGWGDTGYNEHPVLKTPHLDQMAAEGLRFERFYAGAPVCSPTRGSCLTGRHPYRYGVFFANVGHMRPEEMTLAEVLKTQAYATGHFGKWHLGTLTTKIKESNRGGPGSAAHYSPPWENGFDACFSTEAKVPTWNPMRDPKTGRPYGTSYWTGPEQQATENLDGDDSRVIMDRAIPFIRQAVGRQTPFLAVIWFHTPHLPVVAGPEYRKMYEGHPGADYLGAISAMDEQMGRLRDELAQLGIERNTMLWFASDNGPEGRTDTKANGTAKHLRGRKRSLYEGGVRVPGLLVWPERIARGRVVSIPSSTSDYFPTVLAALGYELQDADARPFDGVSLLPVIDGKQTERPRPIAFESDHQLAIVDNRYKIYSDNRGKTYQLFDLIADPAEQRDLAAEHTEIVDSMKGTLESWRASCRASLDGSDYP